MPNSTITIKANNHRIYQCPTQKKSQLLNKIISENRDMEIVVVTANNPSEIISELEYADVKVIEDRELVKDKEFKAQMIISYNIPIKDIVYIARVSRATKKALLLLDESEQQELHQIEMLLGRSIKQDVIEGFEYAKKEETLETQSKSTPKKMTQNKIKEVAKKRYDEKVQEVKVKKFDGEKKRDSKKPLKSDASKKFEKKKKAPNKFLGYDENGKAKFSGKSGERNHRYDGTPKERTQAPKKTGRKINIKARKPKEE